MAFGNIGAALRDQRLAHRDDLADVRGGPGFDIGQIGTELGHVFVECLGIAPGDLADRHPRGRGCRIDLVVHVGDVAGIDNVLASKLLAQQAGQQPEHHIGPRVADMDVVINGRTAHVHGHARRIDRLECFDTPGQRVVEPQSHRVCRFTRNKPTTLSGCAHSLSTYSGWGCFNELQSRRRRPFAGVGA